MSDADSNPAATLDALRARIDEMDAALVKLLNARAACALEIGSIKRAHGMRVYQPRREQRVLAHVSTVSEGPLESEALARLFEQIIDETRRLERRLARTAREGD